MLQPVFAAAVLAAGLLASGCGADPDASPPAVVFDESLGAFFSIRDPGYMGYSRAARALREAGYTVRSNQDPLRELLPRLRPAGEILLVLHPWPGGEWPARGLEAARAFLRRGGSILFLSEHDDLYGAASAANELARGTGIQVVEGRAAASERPAGRARPVTTVHRGDGAPARLYFSAPVRVGAESESRVLARDARGDPVAASARWGRGRLTLVGDSEFLWNGTPELGLRDRGNRAWWLELVRRSLGRAREPSQGPRDGTADDGPRGPGEKETADRGTARPRDGFGLLADTLRAAGLRVRVAGDGEPATTPSEGRIDLRIVAEPTTDETIDAWPARGKEGKTLVLLSAASAPPRLLRGGAVRLQSANGLHPLAEPLARHGLRLQAAVLRRADGSFGVAGSGPGLPASCRWHRVAALRSADEGGSRFEVLARSHAPADPVLLWPASAPRRWHPTLRPGSGGGWPVILRTPDLFVLASGSPLMNGRRGTACYRALVGAVLGWASG